MPIIDIIPGVKVYQADGFSVLFGCPPEVIKHLMVRDIPFPDYIVLPDTVHYQGVLQNATEFPFYYFLFVQGHYFKGRRLSILGTPEQVRNNHDLLRLSLLGPTREEYAALGDSPYFDGLYAESRALSIKDGSGREIQVDEFVDFRAFEGERLDTDQFSLLHLDRNIYEINGQRINVNFAEPQIPPYDLNPDFVPLMPSKFSIDVLGGASGFAASNPCSGLILNYNSDYMLIDCMPYLEYALNARGISREQIKSLFLTHIHDDHCNIFPLVLFNNRTNFLATREVFWMACKKLSLMTGHDIDEFHSYFDFVELEPYRPADFYGMRITPHYTVHSIPTIGAKFEMNYQGESHSIVFVGDNKSLPDIAKMVEEGSVAREKYEYLRRLYRDPHDLFFADGGAGILHGDPRDSLESRADRVVFLHLEELPSEFNTTFTLASHGKRFILQESTEQAYLIRTMQILLRHYPGVSEEWESALLSNLHLVKYNAGDVIMKQGEPRNGIIYIIISGTVSVLHHDGHLLREIGTEEAGEIIGDMAVVNDVEVRSASVVAKIPVILCEISESLFLSFLQSEGRIEPLQQMWSVRRELEAFYPFSDFNDVVNSRLARAGTRITVADGQTVFEQGAAGQEFYIILGGRFAVIRDGKTITELGPGEMFGEYGSLSQRLRNASIEALSDGALLQLPKEDMAHIIRTTPALNFYVHQLLKDRGELDLAESIDGASNWTTRSGESARF